MLSLTKRLLGRLSTARTDYEPRFLGERMPPAIIPTGADFPELCQLAVDPAVDPFNVLGKRFVQLKVDGIRALYIDGRIVTREGVPFDAALHCQPALRRLEQAFGEPMVFDGEYVEEEGFNATLSAFRKGEGTGVLWLFDAVPLSAWKQGVCDRPLYVRLGMLQQHIMAADSPFVGMLDHWELGGPEIEAKARELWAEGYEGVVSKDPTGRYVRGRSRDWVRIKQTLTVDGPIVDALAKDGKLKALIVRTSDGPVRVGTGWTVDAGRDIHDAWLKVEPDSPGALWAEISYQRSTGTTRSIRGARFHRLRYDKGSIK